jgi:hypothetical protein
MMATDFLGSLLVKIVGDTEDLDQKINKSETALQKFSASATRVGAGLTKKLTLPLGLLGAASLKAASDLGESLNAINVVFGDATDTIREFGETSAESVGLSQNAFNELATTIGAQLKQSGQDIDTVADSTLELTRRAADTASVFNVEVSEALNAFGSALRGEAEPARRFGVNISDAAVQAEALASGLVDSKDQIDDQIKVQARYNIILKQTNDLAGDFEKTSESLANRTRILKAEVVDVAAELGQSLIPLAEELVGIAADLIGGFADLDDKTKKLIVTLGLIAAASGPAITAIGAIGTALTFLAANPVGAAVLALGALAAVLITVEKNFRKTQLVAKDTGTKINDAAFELNLLINDYLDGVGAVEDYNNSVSDLTKKYGINRQALIQAVEDQVGWNEEIAKAFGVTNDEILALENVNEELIDFVAQLQAAKDQQEKNNEQTEDDVDAVEAFFDALNEAGEGAEDLADTIDGELKRVEKSFSKVSGPQVLSKGLQEARSEAEQLGSTIAGTLGPVFSALGEAVVDSADGWEIFKEAAKAAIAAVLKGLGEQAAVQSALSFVPGPTFNPVAGVGYGAASAAAFTAAGIVQALKDGGVVQPNNGNQLFQMAEAGVPEMALPLTGPAIDPFADAIAARIGGGGTVNNNSSVNINNMFSLGTDAQARQAAQRFFPFLVAEGQRRGVKLGG